jgi:hypothetical protein
VLYAATHAFSDLSFRTSQGFGSQRRFSYQVHELNAEALETQGRWQEAAAEYQKIIDLNPMLPGIHGRLGRVLLSTPQPSSEAVTQAKKDFEDELEIDPNNATAEYVLGELAKGDGDMAAAVAHYTPPPRSTPAFRKPISVSVPRLSSVSSSPRPFRRWKPTKKWRQTAQRDIINWLSPTTASAARKTPIAKPPCSVTPPSPWNSSNAAWPKASSVKSPCSENRTPHFSLRSRTLPGCFRALPSCTRFHKSRATSAIEQHLPAHGTARSRLRLVADEGPTFTR